MKRLCPGTAPQLVLYPSYSLRAATIYASHIAPSVRSCEELARQAKPPAPPSLQTLGHQGRWGRRFRLPGRPEANVAAMRPRAYVWGYVGAMEYAAVFMK